MEDWSDIHKSIIVINCIYGLKDQNHMIFSIDTEKAFEKIQCAFTIKFLEGIGLEGAYPNIIKAIYIHPQATSF